MITIFLSFSFLSFSSKSNIVIGNLSGRIFEDINYGGGDGRNYSSSNISAQSSGWSNGDIGIGNVRVELYDNSGNFISSTTTNTTGLYTFSALADGTYNVRVVNNTIGSNRGSNSTGETIIPVQTFRMDGISAVVNEVGGANPNLIDANSNTTSANLSSLTTATTTAQSVAEITISGADVLTTDFGYNFDVIVNTNNAGQGSLRQFILNSNELDNTNLDQVDAPSGGVSFPKDSEWETSIFMIAGAGVHRIEPLTVLGTIRDTKTHITGYTQVGAVQGPIISRTINVEIDGNSNNLDGFVISASDLQISGFSIHSLDNAIYSNSTNSNHFFWGNYIGTEADGTTATIGTYDGTGFSIRRLSNSFIGTNGDNINDANEGNLISNCYGGISIRDCGNMLVAGNYIGVDKTGTLDYGNRYNGIYLGSAIGPNYIGFKDDLINTDASHFRNVIAGNGNDAVRIAGSDGQVLAGNYFGTDVTGTVAIKNGNYGVQLQGASNNNIIGTNSNGDDDIKERNIISGNGTGMRFLSGSTGTGNIIAGNFIGTDVTGNNPLPNENHGISLEGNNTGTIVGTNGDNINDAVEGNVISGNDEDGIRTSMDNTIVAGNNIGVGYDGITALGNAQRGILVALDASNNVFGYSPTMANSDELIVGNKIMNNGGSGITVSDVGINNRISQNQIANNTLGIDLGYDGVTENDNGDGDSGANSFINFPIIDTSYVIGPIITVSGFAPPGATVEFFIADAGSSPNPLPGGYTASFGEGAVYLFTAVEGGSLDIDPSIGTYIDDGTGNGITRTQNRFYFSYNILGSGVADGFRLTATATDANNNTSEFSRVTTIYLIEICDNGLDDDGDGLVDANDPDCICCESKAPSLLLLRKE